MSGVEAVELSFPVENANWLDTWLKHESRLTGIQEEDGGSEIAVEVQEFTLKLSDISLDQSVLNISSGDVGEDSEDAEESLDVEEEFSPDVPYRIFSGEMDFIRYDRQSRPLSAKQHVTFLWTRMVEDRQATAIVVNIGINDSIAGLLKRDPDGLLKAWSQYEEQLSASPDTTPLLFPGQPEFGKISFDIEGNDDNPVALMFKVDFLDDESEDSAGLRDWNRGKILSTALDAFERVYPQAQWFVDQYSAE